MTSTCSARPLSPRVRLHTLRIFNVLYRLFFLASSGRISPARASKRISPLKQVSFPSNIFKVTKLAFHDLEPAPIPISPADASELPLTLNPEKLK